ncbi:hypothetical protein Ccrd_011296 [Cynara cardunculus var. scolymus]|uniref:Uncharacterized protein n=1 Tax=Cynara cardunculus var. scolymus TaxID=59895 RepID=A0A103YJL7_CYNCS|nr:hypothetical protein Ccrd_011296 [Cynara cardunculus var. scolymus]
MKITVMIADEQIITSELDRESEMNPNVNGGELFFFQVMREHAIKDWGPCSKDCTVGPNASIGSIDDDICVNAF